MVRMTQYSCFVTMDRDKIYICRILQNGKPDLDPDECYNFTEMHKPPSQGFLDNVNKSFKTTFLMSDFAEEEDVVENIPDIPDTSGLIWEQKNRKEIHK